MDTSRLKVTIESGYRVNVIKALLSSLYPMPLPPENMAVLDVSVSEIKLTGAPTFDEYVGANTISVSSGLLEDQGTITMPLEDVSVLTPSVSAGVLVQVIAEIQTTTEYVGPNNISVVSGLLPTVVITTTPNIEFVYVQTPSVTTGTLA